MYHSPSELNVAVGSSDMSETPTVGDYVSDVDTVLVPVFITVYVIALITAFLLIRSTHPFRRNTGITAAGAAVVLNVVINIMFVHDTPLTGLLAVIGVTHLALTYVLHRTAPPVRNR